MIIRELTSAKGTHRLALAVALAATMVLTACSSDGSGATASPTGSPTTAPATTADAPTPSPDVSPTQEATADATPADDAAASDADIGDAATSGAADTAAPATGAATEACSDTQFASPDTAPGALEDIDAPFYPCVHEMSAVTDTDPSFVGEYVTTHEQTAVESAIDDQIDASNWEVLERSAEGQNSVIMLRKSGNLLVVAVGPSRSGGSDISIYYTLRPA